MPQVPAYTPNQVRTAPVTSAKQQGIGSTGFGGPIAEGLSALGHSAEVAQHLAVQKQDTLDEASARQLDIEFATHEREALWGENGLYRKSGQDALLARPQVEEGLRARAQELSGKAQSKQQRDMFDRVVQQRLQGALNGIERYDAEQTRAYNMTTLAASIDVNSTNAALQYADPVAQGASIATVRGNVLDQLTLQGYGHDKNIVEREMLKATSTIHAQALGAMVTGGDYGAAKDYLDKHGGDMTLGARTQVEASLKGEVDKAKVVNGSDVIFAQARGDLTLALATAAKIKDPTIRLATETRLETLATRDRNVKKLAGADTWAQVQLAIKGGMTVEEFPAPLAAALAQSGYLNDAYAFQKTVAEGRVPTKNGPTYTALQVLAYRDPQAFSKMNLDGFVDKMPHEEFTELVKVQTGQVEAWSKQFKPDVDRVMMVLGPQLSVLKGAMKGDERKLLMDKAESYALTRVRELRDKGEKLTDSDVSEIVKRGLTLTKEDGDRLPFLETRSGQGYAQSPKSYAILSGTLRHTLGREPTYTDLAKAYEADQAGKPVVPYSKIPSNFLPNSRSKFSRAQVQELYNDMLMGREPRYHGAGK